MTRMFFLLLAPLLSMSSPAMVGDAEIWHSPLAARTVAHEAHSSAGFVELNKLLASQQQMGEVGQIIAGPSERVRFRDAQRVAEQYGGNASDWVKKTSSSSTFGRTTFETH